MKKETRPVSEMVESGEVLHRWTIETPNGPTSIGVCLLHKHTKTFSNSLPDVSLKDRMRSKGQYQTRQKARMVDTEYLAPLNDIDWEINNG